MEHELLSHHDITQCQITNNEEESIPRAGEQNKIYQGVSEYTGLSCLTTRQVSNDLHRESQSIKMDISESS